MAKTRNRRSNLKYESLLQSLREQIKSGHYKPNDSLLSESQLCQQFGVSRGPVRQALDVLTRERLIYRIPGKGSFVSDTVAARQPNKVKCLHVLVDAAAGLDDNYVVLEIIQGLTHALPRLSNDTKLHYEFHRFQGRDDINEEELIEGKDGLLIIPFTQYCVHFIESLRDLEIPVVAMFDKVNTSELSNLYVDHEEAAYRATHLLARLGHKRIAHVTDAVQPGSFASQVRRAGYKRAMKEHKLEPELWSIEGSDLNPIKVRDTVVGKLERTPKTTALLIGGGHLTSGVLQAVNQVGLHTPQDISIFAFDDTAEAAMHNPPLCVIKQPLTKLAEWALEQLSNEVDQPMTQRVQTGLVPDLILRDSYAPLDS